ncbi:MAG: long-chain fatty acid--CoA ligase [Bacillota bacterium]
MDSIDRFWLKHYPEGVRPHLEYPDKALYTYLEETAAAYPTQIATEFMGAKRTYAQLADDVSRLAAALTALGVGRGDRVAVMLPNCPQCVMSYYAVLRAGGVVVFTNPLYVEREIEFQLKDSGAETMITLDMLWPRVAAVQGRTKLKNVIVTSVADYLKFPLKQLYPIKAKKEGQLVHVPPGAAHRFTALMAKHKPAPAPFKVTGDDIALFQYTGGTTGTSKGVILSNRNLVANTLQTAEWLVNTKPATERTLCALPFFHVYGMTTCMNFAVMNAGTMILLPRFIVKDVLKTIQKTKPTLFPGAPTMYVALNNYPEVQKYDLKSIKACISGAAPLMVETYEQFEKLSGGRLVEGYGLTEAAPVTHANPIWGKRKAGSIGLPFPDTDVKIVDVETGTKVLPIGEIGELCVRGPQVMIGYWGKREETALVLRDGWLHTGDIAKMDDEGYAYIVERKKDMIIAGGYNIYPREVEEVLYEHPKVKEAAVAGIKDPYRGETVKAYIVLKEGETATAEEFIDFCKGKMAKFKVPTLVEFRGSLPRTLVGKVLRRVLIEEEQAKQAGKPA